MRNSSRGAVDPFIVMDVMEAARQAEDAGRHVIHMEVGQPGTPAPVLARESLVAAMRDDPLGYTVALGLPALRRRIARLYGDWYNVDLDPARVVVTPGSSGGFILAFTALFDAGDRIALGAPGYPSYRQIMKSLSLKPVEVQTRAEARFQLEPSDLEGIDYHGMMVASPANPTGTMMSSDALTELIRFAEAEKIWFISDEIYHGLDYSGDQKSALEISDNAIIINSFSKYYCMTGWRIGWMVLPDQLVRPAERLAQNLYISAPEMSQLAATAALGSVQELEAVKAGYVANRELLLEGLPAIGFDQLLPVDGAFYIYADISRFSDDSLRFARQMLHDAGVAATPGVDFDPVHGHKFLRFSFAGAHENMKEALVRMSDFLSR
jgi:aspartate/methionine/tyrosine aminotransferase